ncbi:MAG TPA: bifunctional diaminohydroxyphosphoribosylaminopyrimidine deaminase/5-amino-6-(5-phosphoribosylamino)uracil reductase RibD [Sedimentisphaerales bacterium]|nr:bifunctional diaminohydroxyphosphoribosylaminopyrimidine deaminase/5-amino-6-(5-phosphoribosylamino)uracil reductase RibD [Sedimentisphaerales bacterium]
MADRHEKYMQAALKLARRGIGSVEPNPAVGCLIVKANQTIGKGWHKKFGGPHAEVNALEDCRTLGVNPKGATMYLTLEPCSHHGKTPPCTDAIINSKVAKVVVATIDPSEHARGRGVRQLRRAGIEVKTGVCETQARLLNAPFIKFAATGRCWVILKWAQSIDAKVAYVDKASHAGERSWISNETSRKDAHKLRRRAQAILVGINTVLADDPLLTARPGRGRQPARVVLDTSLRIPLDCRLLAAAQKVPVLVLTSARTVQENPQAAEAVRQKGAELLIFPDTPGRSNLHFLMDELSKRRIAQLLVEGGPRVITSFFTEHLADEVCVYIAPKLLGGRGTVDLAAAMAGLSEVSGLCYVDIKRLGNDVRLTGLSKRAVAEISILEG